MLNPKFLWREVWSVLRLFWVLIKVFIFVYGLFERWLNSFAHCIIVWRPWTWNFSPSINNFLRSWPLKLLWIGYLILFLYLKLSLIVNFFGHLFLKLFLVPQKFLEGSLALLGHSSSLSYIRLEYIFFLDFLIILTFHFVKLVFSYIFMSGLPC